MKMLAKIIENKRKEVEISKRRLPLSSFKSKLKISTRDFKKAISKNKLNIIAEIKRASPSSNTTKKIDMGKIAGMYGKYADAISVLTDKKFFGGSLMDLNEVSKLSKLPLLRKDFIVDEYQIYESRLFNADAILLIASVLTIEEINSFIETAGKYGMDCLVEVNTGEELDKALRTKSSIIGINNRNLNTLKIDMSATLRLAVKIPKGKIIVSESGIVSMDYVKQIKGKANAILVGTFFIN